ncbi:crosslink repair DNA glycosylase YcaQ family protein [Amycolatopsis sp. NPDC047767]|uniref:DNA glycosylase AlkZ-like family protein n=1 Tax=Amycolatopsis sp. NPDC047767 TaxID=3156765 RepID=UPI00345571FC
MELRTRDARRPGARDVCEVLGALRCLQLDSISVVAHSHHLVLRSPLHQALIRAYPAEKSAYGRRVAEFLHGNAALRDHILDRLRESGPLPAGAFEDRSTAGWVSGGWTTGRNVERMLDVLWFRGEIMVASRTGGKRLWDLASRCLPAGLEPTPLTETEIVTRCAEYALRAPRRRAALLEAITAGGWTPHTTLLSPFDNLICDRGRTQRLWGFEFRTEMYVPKAKRRYGYYVLPVLHGDRLIGQVAPRVDRRRRAPELEGVHAEATAPTRAGAAVHADQELTFSLRHLIMRGTPTPPYRKA